MLVILIKRKIYKNGQISIPKHLQEELKITDGDLLFVYIVNKTIFIEAAHDNETLNQCYIRDGRISIPTEIRRILTITNRTTLIMGISEDKQKIYVKINEVQN
ncbi:AbrB/MazE/SpoVT family DNA-binding domain-containing protein [Niallia sp. 01092]|uniref:AbrB/MazE/SpoVT family DNA-binding domain-containing protein n=1 Tax=unclassified Niallia TaxID=2837522 RepID=UPI003FD2811B